MEDRPEGPVYFQWWSFEADPVKIAPGEVLATSGGSGGRIEPWSLPGRRVPLSRATVPGW
jgi:hypothetical protein